MSDTIPPLSQQQHLWNCLSCKRRKVRCDRQQPCSNCVKGQRNCVFPTSGRTFQRRNPESRRPLNKSPQTDLLNRLSRLENAVDTLHMEWGDQTFQENIQPSPSTLDGTQNTTSQHVNSSFDKNITPSLMEWHQDRDISSLDGHSESESPLLQSPIIVSGTEGGIYVGNRFWAKLRQEIKIVRETFAELEDDKSDFGNYYAPSFLPSHQDVRSEGLDFVFGRRSQGQMDDNLEKLQPLPSQMLFIWQTFVENVSPVIHILHTPTLLKALQDCKCRLQNLDMSMRSLFFAISTIAIDTLTTEEVKINFGKDKHQFLAQLRFGTEQALAQADFINTTSIVVVQALTLYIFHFWRDKSSRYVWSLAGLLIRIAVSIGLHRDGSHFPNVTPFEVENRRRLWWHICCFDERLGESQVPGVGLSHMDFDTMAPTNVNDDDLDPGMLAPPAPREGYTDTSLSLIRRDIWRVMQRVKSISSKICSNELDPDKGIATMLDDLQKVQKAAKERLNMHPDESISRVLNIIFTLRFNTFQLVIKHQRRQASQDNFPDTASFALAISVLQDAALVQQSEAGRRFAWILQGHVPWQPYAIILSRICSLPWDDSAESAWELVNDNLRGVAEAVQVDPFWQPLRILLDSVHRHRAQQLKLDSSGQYVSSGPLTEQNGCSPPNSRLGEVSAHLSSFRVADTTTPGAGPENRQASYAASGDIHVPFENSVGGSALEFSIENLDPGDWHELLWAGVGMY